MLFYLILLVAVMAGSAVFITKFTMWTISKLGHKYIEMTHRSAEFIVNTGAVPPFWYDGKRAYPFPLWQKMRCLKRLKKLISYFENSTVAGDEKTRKLVASRLIDAYNVWVEKEWEELLPSGR